MEEALRGPQFVNWIRETARKRHRNRNAIATIRRNIAEQLDIWPQHWTNRRLFFVKLGPTFNDLEVMVVYLYYNGVDAGSIRRLLQASYAMSQWKWDFCWRLIASLLESGMRGTPTLKSYRVFDEEEDEWVRVNMFDYNPGPTVGQTTAQWFAGRRFDTSAGYRATHNRDGSHRW